MERNEWKIDATQSNASIVRTAQLFINVVFNFGFLIFSFVVSVLWRQSRLLFACACDELQCLGHTNGNNAHTNARSGLDVGDDNGGGSINDRLEREKLLHSDKT